MRRCRPLAIRRTHILAGLMTLSVSMATCSQPSVPEGPSVLLITVDTLRADALGAYLTRSSSQLNASPTPRIDALAAQGVLFENAAASMPLTRPSHFSIFTAQYPRQHGVMNNEIALPETVTTLPEIFAAHGYRTGAFVSVSLLNEASGAAQGFETFEHPSIPRERRGETAVGDALAWLETLAADAPFFGWVHLFDPHLPYDPPETHRARLDPELAARWPSLNWQQLFAIAHENDGDIPVAVFDHALALYRGEVEYIDTQIGVLLDGLAAQDRLDDTIIVFTADHGEAFENGVFFEHADSLYDGATRIPLIISHGGRRAAWPAAGTRVTQQVSVIDIAPTLLAAAEIEIPEDYSGRPLQTATQFGDRYVLVQHPFYQQSHAVTHPEVHSAIQTVAGQPVSQILVEKERVGLVGVEWKLLRTDEDSALFNRTLDPEEVHDLALDEVEIRRQLEAALAQQLAAHPLRLIDPGQINEELRDTLEALGYLN